MSGEGAAPDDSPIGPVGIDSIGLGGPREDVVRGDGGAGMVEAGSATFIVATEEPSAEMSGPPAPTAGEMMGDMSGIAGFSTPAGAMTTADVSVGTARFSVASLKETSDPSTDGAEFKPATPGVTATNVGDSGIRPRTVAPIELAAPGTELTALEATGSEVTVCTTAVRG